MKKTIVQISALLLVCVLCIGSFTVTAAAAGSINYLGRGVGVGVGSTNALTTTDLFGGFKNVMPGDRITDTVTIKNSAASCDYINVFLRVQPHSTANMPKAAGIDSLTEMMNFLNTMTLTVSNGSKVIFNGKAGETAQMTNLVLVTQLRRGKSTNLKLRLDVPITAGNEFANQIGEVDWVFVVEERNFEGGRLIQTGLPFWPMVILGGLGAVLVVGGVLLLRKKRDA